MQQSLATRFLDGTGPAVAQHVAELIAISECGDVVLVTRKPIAARSRVRNTVLDSGRC
jgi:hypothetical protein